jgi:hypothetical protein
MYFVSDDVACQAVRPFPLLQFRYAFPTLICPFNSPLYSPCATNFCPEALAYALTYIGRSPYRALLRAYLGRVTMVAARDRQVLKVVVLCVDHARRPHGLLGDPVDPDLTVIP